MGMGFLKNLATILNISKKDKGSPEGSFIEKDGVMISICDTSVSVQDIFNFFQDRMPWLEIIVSENVPPEFTNEKAKEELYQHFIEHLETQHYEWTEAFKKEPPPIN